MLGNGFDLHHELLTHYNEFITIGKYLSKKYCLFTDKKINVYCELKQLADEDEAIKKKLILYKDAYLKTEINCKQYYDFIQSLQSNYWFKYFADIKSRTGWVSLENQIAEFLKKIKNKDFSDMSYFHDLIKQYYEYSDNEFKYIKNYVFLKEDNDNIIFKEYENFVELLKTYLIIFVDNVLPNISELYCFKNDFLKQCDHIISFNYTDTYKQLYNSDVNMVYIHGKLDSNIIVGINSDEYDNVGSTDLRFLNYKKYYQRIINHTFDGLRKLILELELTKSKKQLKVIGHSLDKSDEDIITVIFDWFDNILIYYYDDEALDRHVKNLKVIFGAKKLSEMTFSQKIVFEKLPLNEYTKVMTNDQL